MVIIFFLVVVAILGVMYVSSTRSNAKKKSAILEDEAVTFEDKMLYLQKESNKRLKDIDTTLDYFFWFLVISLVLTVVYGVMQSLP